MTHLSLQLLRMLSDEPLILAEGSQHLRHCEHCKEALGSSVNEPIAQFQSDEEAEATQVLCN